MSGELVALAQRLIGYETSEPEANSEAAGFIKGWLEARGIEAEREFWLAETNLGSALLGGSSGAASSETMPSTAPAPESAGGH